MLTGAVFCKQSLYCFLRIAFPEVFCLEISVAGSNADIYVLRKSGAAGVGERGFPSATAATERGNNHPVQLCSKRTSEYKLAFVVVVLFQSISGNQC